MELRALIFDFGNTLAPFNAPEADGVDHDLARFVAAEVGLDAAAFFVRWRQEREVDFARSVATGREHDFRDRMRRTLAAAGRAPSDGLVGRAEARVVESFCERVRVAAPVRDAVAALGRRYRVAVLSNYLLAAPIHAVLARDGVAPHLAAALVSKEVDFAKPHPRVFEAILDLLGVSPAEAVYVGDDWHADVCGARACGMGAVWTWAMREPRPELPAELPDRVLVLPTAEAYRAFLAAPEACLGW